MVLTSFSHIIVKKLQQNFDIIMSMIRNSTILAIIMVAVLHNPALADSQVRVRSDGKVIDPDGKIIAIQNPNDARNSPYEKYYTTLGKDGKPAATTSDFFIVADDNGYSRKDLTPAPDPVPQAAPQQVVAQNIKPSVTNHGLKTIQIYSNPDVPLYDSLSAANNYTVYGDIIGTDI